MMIEGREGTILSAVGAEEDHKVATEVLKWHQTQRLQLSDRSAAPIQSSQPQTLGRAIQPSQNALRAREKHLPVRPRGEIRTGILARALT
jgi:hypothetical protein